MIRNRPAAHVVQLLLPVIVLAAPLAVPVGASLSVQEQTVTIMAAGDISPDPGAAKDDDIATSNLILDADPTAVLTLGDNQCNCSGPCRRAATGLTVGRLLV